MIAVSALVGLVGCGGHEFEPPDLTRYTLEEIKPVELEVVHRLGLPPGNLTLTPDDRLVMSLHQHYAPEMRVVEVMPSGTIVPFPNAEWNDPSRPADQRLDTVLGIQSDPDGIVWMLDNGMRGNVTPKLVAWDTTTDSLHRVIKLPQPITRETSFLNDLAVDSEHGVIYIADTDRGGKPAIIVVHPGRSVFRRALQQHPALVANQQLDMVIDGEPLMIKPADGEPFKPRVPINPIALSPDNQTLYFGPMTGKVMYQMDASVLRNPLVADDVLFRSVEPYGEKPISDGSTADAAGNVYITDITNHAIGVTRRDGSYVQLARDPELLQWPDAFSYGPDGYIYVAVNQLHKGPVLNAGQDASEPPFLIVRFMPPAKGVVGR